MLLLLLFLSSIVISSDEDSSGRTVGSTSAGVADVVDVVSVAGGAGVPVGGTDVVVAAADSAVTGMLSLSAKMYTKCAIHFRMIWT